MPIFKIQNSKASQVSNIMSKEEIFKKLSHFLVPDDSAELSESILKFIIRQSLFSKESVDTSALPQIIKDEFDLEFEVILVEISGCRY